MRRTGEFKKLGMQNDSLENAKQRRRSDAEETKVEISRLSDVNLGHRYDYNVRMKGELSEDEPSLLGAVESRSSRPMSVETLNDAGKGKHA